MMLQSFLNKKAFSFPELVMVIVIISILSVIILPKISSQLDNARIKNAEIEIAEIINAIGGDSRTGASGYYQDVGAFPTNFQGLQALYTLLAGVPTYSAVTGKGWNGPYIGDKDGDGSVDADEAEEALYDPWGNMYVYNLGAEAISVESGQQFRTQEVTVSSNGPDESQGTADDIELNYSSKVNTTFSGT